MSEDKILAAIIMGSKSDWDTMRAASEVLTDFDVPHECKVLSAHRTPEQLKDYLSDAEARGCEVFIGGAGGAAHLAGTIAAIDNDIGVVGVAADASVVAVRVLDRRGSGAYSWVIAGLDYVAANAAAGDVVNMSLGGPPSDDVDAAVLAVAEAGIRVAIAAGNDGADANGHSPARVNHGNVYTVSAVDAGDAFAPFSNWGNPPVDYAAPGVGILSLWKRGKTNTISGTSMATPHVAGILLLGNVSADGTAGNDPDGNPDPIAHR